MRRTTSNSLSLKLTVCLVGGMAVAFTLLGLRIVRLHREHLEGSTRDAGQRIGDVIKRSTRFGMLNNHRAEIEEVVKTIGAQPGIEAIRIYNKSGEVTFSTRESEAGSRVDERADACRACHAQVPPRTHISENNNVMALTSSERTRIFRDATGHRVLGVINAVENEPSCSTAACHAHSAQTNILGVIDVTMSLERVDAVTAESGWEMTASFLAAGLLLALAASVLVWVMVHKPVSRLITGTKRVGWGDLDYKIDASSRDELGELAESFNRMTHKLRHAQSEINHWTRTLESRVADKTAELRQAHEQIVHVEKMASIGRLAAIVAHEINNPLAGILVYSKLLLKRMGRHGSEAADDETRKHLETIAAESARCGEIVKGLLQFSRQTKPKMGPNDLNEIVRESLRLVQHKLELMGARADVSLDEKIVEAVCDAQQIKQALVALFINACEAMRQGEGVLTVETRSLQDARAIEICIRDNGVGMDEETRQCVFEPFFTTKEQGKGVGLGLSVVYAIVHNHAGEIEVESAPEAGAAFRIRLPQDATVRPVVEQTEAQAALRLQGASTS